MLTYHITKSIKKKKWNISTECIIFVGKQMLKKLTSTNSLACCVGMEIFAMLFKLGSASNAEHRNCMCAKCAHGLESCRSEPD